MEAINSQFKQQLIQSELAEKRNEIGNFLHRQNGENAHDGGFQYSYFQAAGLSHNRN